MLITTKTFFLLSDRVPAVLVTVLILMVQQETEVGNKHDPNFQYGSAQAIVALLLLWFSLFSKLCDTPIRLVSLPLIEMNILLQHKVKRKCTTYHYSITVCPIFNDENVCLTGCCGIECLFVFLFFF